VGVFGFGCLRDFGTAVMARWTGRRDRGVRGIPGVVADHDAGAARDGRWPGAGGASGIRGTHAEGERERTTGVSKGGK
jgi:hypothetical protein